MENPIFHLCNIVNKEIGNMQENGIARKDVMEVKLQTRIRMRPVTGPAAAPPRFVEKPGSEAGASCYRQGGQCGTPWL